MRENYLAKWLNNELSKEELAEFKKSAEFASYQKIAEASQELKAPEFSVDHAWNAFKERELSKETKVIPLNPFKPFLRVAAVIALLLGGAYFYLNSQGEKFSTQLAEQTEVVLPDASKVILNADSQLSFDKKNWDDNRNIQLNGEAFFKVAKGKKFTVSTHGGTVAVLGTQFNVESRNDFFEVTCYEGLVSVTYKGKELQLPAGNSFVSINGEIQQTDAIVVSTPSWTQNESTFKSIPLRYVLAELERQFNIEVETQNINTEQLFTGTFNNTDINLALESISTPSQIRYKLEADKVLFYAGNTP
jgi:ferric-dicitrate binding protein FerR (iron transport regulator)